GPGDGAVGGTGAKPVDARPGGGVLSDGRGLVGGAGADAVLGPAIGGIAWPTHCHAAGRRAGRSARAVGRGLDAGGRHPRPRVNEFRADDETRVSGAPECYRGSILRELLRRRLPGPALVED